MKKVITILFYNILLFVAVLVTICFVMVFIPDSSKHGVSLASRFLDYVMILVLFDFGYSLVTGFPIWDTILSAGLKSLLLVSGGLLLVVLVASVTVIAQINWPENKFVILWAFLVRKVSAVPILIWATVLIFLSFTFLSVVPVYQDISGFNLTSMLAVALPLLALASGDNILGDTCNRMLNRMQELNNSLFIRALEARGFQTRFHILRNMVPEVLSILSSRISYLITGMIVVEFIFNWQGLGWMIWRAIIAEGEKDYALVLACSACIVLFVIVLNITRDISLKLSNPHLYVN